MKRTRPLVAIIALALFPAVLWAQEEMSATEPSAGAIFEGQVVDSLTGDPIEGVLLRMDVGVEVFTDPRGEFRFDGLPQGKRLFAMLTEDCRITWGEITVVEGIPRRKRLRLPPTFRAAAAAQAEEQVRRESTSGRRITAVELDAMNASSVMEVIRRVAPNMLGPMGGDPGLESSFRSSRGRSLGAADPPVIVVDGVRMTGAEGTLGTMRPEEVEELEIQPGAAAGWEYGSSGASGVIKIRLRRGLPDGAEPLRTPASCVVPSFPRN